MSAASVEPPTWTPLAESLRRLRTLVSPYCGLVRGVSDLACAPDDARLVRVGCRLAALEPLIGFTTDFRAGGSAPDRDEALAAALRRRPRLIDPSRIRPKSNALRNHLSCFRRWSDLGLRCGTNRRVVLLGASAALVEIRDVRPK